MEPTVTVMILDRQAAAQPSQGPQPVLSPLPLPLVGVFALFLAVLLGPPAAGAETARGQWLLTAGQGDRVAHSSGGGNDARLIGPQWARNGERYALDFDGNSGVVDCGVGSVLNPSQAITVEAWIYPRSFGQSDYGRIVERNVYSLMMHRGYGWGLAFTVQDSQGKPHSCALGESVEFDRWHHVVGRFDGQAQRLFVNGVQGGVTADWTGTIRLSSDPLLIGNVGGGNASAGAGKRTFDGLIDEVAVFSRALTDEEIATRHRLGRRARPSPPESADPQALFAEAFADGEAALGRWEFRGDPQAKLSIGPAGRASQRTAVYIDFRERAAWRLLSRQSIALRATEQYTLSARVRRNLGYGQMRVLAETVGTAAASVVAETEVIDRSNTARELSVVFRVAADTEVRIGLDASGYAELWLESIRLRRNDPPISSYTTGMLLPARSPLTQARYRTGVFLEAEDIVATADAATAEDNDGDGRWALCRVDPAMNPWLFSDETVLKSDSLSVAERGTLPALKLTAKGLLPGPYEILLSDPQRDAAVALDGQTWRRVKGGAGELNLGLVDVASEFSVWVSHRYRDEANPGPIYVDYLRLMPVYDASRGLEQPLAAMPAAPPPPVQQTVLRLLQTRGVPRHQEWVTGGMPLAQGAYRPGDGIRVEGVAGLATLPLVLWPDGSVKWLRLQFQADAEADGRKLPVSYGRGVPVATALSATGPSPERQSLPRAGAGTVLLGTGVWAGLELAVRVRTAAGACFERLRVESVVPAAEGQGPRASPELRGHLLTADGSLAPLAFQVLVTETAPQTLGLRFSLLNESDERYEPEKGCSPALPLTEFTVVLTHNQAVPIEVQWPSGELPLDSVPQRLEQGGTGPCVAEFKGAWRLRAGDAVVASGERTDGWLELRGPGYGLAVGVREFVEKCPQSLAVRRLGDSVMVDVGVWPAAEGRVLRFAQGTRLTSELALVRHDGTLPAAEREARLASVLDPLVAVLPSAYTCQTGVFGPVTEKTDSRFSGYYAGAAHTLEILQAEHMCYGPEDWGDTFDRCGYVRTESKLWTNMEWNAVAALVVEFVRSGDPGFWRAALQSARHFVDRDVAHISSTSAWTGGSYVHTGDTREGHQVDPPNFAHAGWPEGLLWLYYMTGDRRLRETAVGLADYVVRNMPPEGPYQAQPPFSMWNCDRQAGNPILTLASVYEVTHDPAQRHALDRLVDFALRVQDPKLGCWSVPNYEEPARHYPSPAWGAVLPRGLHLYWQMTGDARVAQAFRRLADFHLARHPPETRYYFRPDSLYRKSAYFVSEGCAFASLFAAEPRPLIEKGLAALAELFPTASPRALDARGAPGGLSAGSRLAGAAAAAEVRPMPPRTTRPTSCPPKERTMPRTLIWPKHSDLAIRKTPTVRREEYLDFMTFRRNERPLFTEIFGPLVGLKEEWLAQGASPEELDFSAFRYRCPATGGIPVNTGQLGQIRAPCVLQETEEFVLSRDSLGRTLRLYKGVATIPLPESGHPVRNMDDWRRIRHLFEFSTARLAGDWERAARAHVDAGLATVAGIPGGFDLPRQLMGEENVCLAYYEQPDLIHDILSTVGDTAFQVLEAVSRTVPIDILSVHEDMAGKSGPLAGPRQIEEFIRPYYRRLWDLLAERGTRLFDQDSDGDMNAVIPAFLEAGVNCMHPMEPAANMDIVKIRQRYGTRLAFYGGIDKHVLRRGPAEITAELEYKIPPMVASGACVLGLDHRITNGTPLANYRFYVAKAWEIMERESGSS